MKYIVVIAAMLALCGCATNVGIGDKLDQTKIGDLSFSQKTGENGYFTCVISGKELAPVLMHLQRQEKIELVLITHTQPGTLKYNEKNIDISWSRIKMGETVFRFTIENDVYELKAPYGEQFSHLMEKYRKKALFPLLLKK